MRKMILLLQIAASLSVTAQVKSDEAPLKKDSVFTVELGEVSITAKRDNQRLSKGGIITDISGTSLSELGTCVDVIAQLPGVISNGGDIEIPGKGIPQIYINNRKVVDRTELERLSSKDIKSVEVLFNPGARYGAETKSVILVKTVRKQGDGMSGAASVMGKQAHYLSNSDNLSLNFRSGGFDLFGALNYDLTRGYQKQQEKNNIYTSADNYLIESDKRIYPKYNTYMGMLGGNVQIKDDHFLGIKYEYTATPDYESKWLTKEDVVRNNIPEDNIVYDTRWRGSSAPVHLVNTYYQGKVKSFDISINNDYYFKSSDNSQTIEETSIAEGSRVIRSESNIRNMMIASKGIAEYSFHGNTLEFGYEITSTSRRDIFHHEGDVLPDSDDKIKELTGAGYVAMNIPVKEVELYAGLRYEHTRSDYYSRGVLIKEQSRKYGRLFPNIDFTFPIDKAKFTLSYEVKTKRPLYSQLSSSIQFDDRFTFEKGNPLLASEITHNVSLAGIYRWLFFNVTYSYDRDPIISTIRLFKDDEPQNIMSYENFNHLSKYNVVVSLSPRIAKWSPRLRLNLMGQFFSVNTGEDVTRLNTPVLFFNYFNSLALGKGFIINGDISGRTRGDMDVVTLRPSWQINLGVSKNLGDWFFQMQATDILKTARGSMITYGTRLTLDKWNYSDTRSVRLIIRYSFNTARSKYKGKGAGITERNRL